MEHETEQDRIEMEEFLAQPLIEVVIKERNMLRKRCADLEAEIARLEKVTNA